MSVLSYFNTITDLSSASRLEMTSMNIPPLVLVFVEWIVVIFLFLPTLVLETSVKPFQRGFFCNDESLMYPYKQDTISTTLLIILSFAIAIVVVLLVEIAVYFTTDEGLRESRQTCCRSCVAPGYVVVCVRYLLWTAFTVGATMMLTDITKYTLGRLRPHFFDICGIKVSALNCSTGYIQSYTCIPKVPKKMKDAHLSFPSGHSSVAAALAVYLSIYIQNRLGNLQNFRLVRALGQVVLISLAIACGCSRVSDYKHHWSDVIGGFVLGSVIAISVSYVFISSLEEESTDDITNTVSFNSAPIGMNELGTRTTIVDLSP